MNRLELQTLLDIASIELPNRPCFPRWLNAIDLGDGRLHFRADRFAFSLNDQFYVETFQAIRQLLDGTRTVDAIVQACDLDPDSIIFVLKVLRHHGALFEGRFGVAWGESSSVETPLFRFFSHFTSDPGNDLAVLRAASVRVVGADRIGSHVLQNCSQLEIAAEQANDLPSASVDVLVACDDTGDREFFRRVNAHCIRHKQRWMHVAYRGREGILGPTFVPGMSACFTCLELRELAHDDEPRGYEAHLERSHDVAIDEGYAAPILESLAAQAVMELSRLLVGYVSPATVGSFWVFASDGPQTRQHRVLRLPRCPDCGRGPNTRAPFDQERR